MINVTYVMDETYVMDVAYVIYVEVVNYDDFFDLFGWFRILCVILLPGGEG